AIHTTADVITKKSRAVASTGAQLAASSHRNKLGTLVQQRLNLLLTAAWVADGNHETVIRLRHKILGIAQPGIVERLGDRLRPTLVEEAGNHPVDAMRMVNL